MTSSPTPASAGDFLTTRWSMVLAACTDTAAPNDALSDLCRAYWQPLYRFVRRSGHQPADAQDLTQAFFERLIERRFIQAANADRGRFRTFLLASLKNFVRNEWKKSTREKRGGGRVRFLDFATADQWLANNAVTVADVEAEFDRDWAVGLVSQVVEQLRLEYESQDRSELFKALSPYLTSSSVQLPYVATAQRYGMTSGQVKVYVHRLRSRYRELLQQEIANTVSSPELVEDELQYLFAVLSTPSSKSD